MDFETDDTIRSDHIPFIVSLKPNSRSRRTKYTNQIRSVKLDLLPSIAQRHHYAPDVPISKEALDTAVDQITAAIQGAINEATSVKEVTLNTDKPLLLPKHIQELIKLKRTCRRKFQRSHSTEDKVELNRLTAKVRLEINKFKGDRWKSFCSSLNCFRSSDSKLWKAINSIDNNEAKFRTTKLRDEQGNLTSNTTEVADIFANHMEKVFSSTVVRNFNEANFNKINEAIPTLFSSMENEIPLPQVSPLDIKTAIRSEIGSRGAPGEDQITNKALKHLPPSYHESIANIFNSSIKLGYVPKAWKNATIVMIPKPKKDHSLAGSHRPISLLRTLSKLLERVINSQVVKWLDANNIINPAQAGFRKGRQTKDQILRLIQDGIEAFNKRQHLGAVFIDIEKAFDNVWIDGLLYKLDGLKIPNYLGRWIQSYLKERSFQIKCMETLSSRRPIQSGVPQGSVLGPVLFLIFFNDICKPPHPREPSEALFADDVALWVASSSFKVIQLRLQKRLDEVEKWMNDWRTILSVEKTELSLFNKAGRLYDDKVKLSYNGRAIKTVRNFKFLGVTLDPSLSLHNHAKIIQERAQRRINMLRRIRGRDWGASPKLILTTYKVLIRPIIEYAPFTILLMSESNQTLLQRIQNAAIRVSMYWEAGATSNEMNTKAKLELLTERAARLSSNYIVKAYQTNESIKERLDAYSTATILAEGLHARGKPRTSVLGIISQNMSDSKIT